MSNLPHHDPEDLTWHGTATTAALWSVGLLLGFAGRSAAAEPSPSPSAAEVVSMPADVSTQKPAIIPLLTKESLQTADWVFVSRDQTTPLTSTWQIVDAAADDPVLLCQGTPYGYLRTSRAFDDFEMELEWRFLSDENGNSGILVYTSEEDRIWPKAMQIQLHQPVAGSIFPSGDARADNEIRDVRHLARPIREWNQCRISSVLGTLSVEINGKKVGEVTGCRPRKGGIALQSEGSVIEFRRIRIREMIDPVPPAAEAPEMSWLPGDPEPSLRLSSMSCQGASAVVPFCALPVQQPRGDVVLSHRDQRRQRRQLKGSHVVHRDTLAAGRAVVGCGDCLCGHLGAATSVVVAGGSHRLRRAEHRRAGF